MACSRLACDITPRDGKIIVKTLLGLVAQQVCPWRRSCYCCRSCSSASSSLLSMSTNQDQNNDRGSDSGNGARSQSPGRPSSCLPGPLGVLFRLADWAQRLRRVSASTPGILVAAMQMYRHLYCKILRPGLPAPRRRARTRKMLRGGGRGRAGVLLTFVFEYRGVLEPSQRAAGPGNRYHGSSGGCRGQTD